MDATKFVSMFTYKNQFNGDVADPTAITNDSVSYSIKLITKTESGDYV